MSDKKTTLQDERHANFFTKTNLSRTPEQTNPLHILNGLSRVTIMGEGGVSNDRGVKEEERMVHPSHLGFLDLLLNCGDDARAIAFGSTTTQHQRSYV